MLTKLRQLGWGDYEAKAYLALLRCHPATGYRVGKEAGVPGAKIYEALARLVERGAVRRNDDMDTALYTPVAPDELVAGVRAQQTRMLDDLGRELTALASAETDMPETERLHGRPAVLGRLASRIAAAQISVAVALPQAWQNTLRAECEAARARRVRVDRTLMSETTGDTHFFVVVTDSTDAIIGTFGERNGDDAAALAARSSFLVRLCADYVRLRRAIALAPDVVMRLQRQDDWLDWEEAKQRRLLQHNEIATRTSRMA